MIKLVVKICLVLNHYICLPPIEIIPETGQIASITSCLMGGEIYMRKVDGAEWFVKVYCSQSPSAFENWHNAHK